MNKYFDKYSDEIAFLKSYFKEKNYKYIARFNYYKTFFCQVTTKEVLNKNETESEGFGIQIFTKNGGVGFATSDIISKEAIENVCKLGIELAKNSEEHNQEDLSFFEQVVPYNEDVYTEVNYPIDYISFSEREKKLLQLQDDLDNEFTDFSIKSTLYSKEEHWRIIRDDGTDTAFLIPRCFVNSILTYKKNGEAVTMMVPYVDKGYDIFYDKERDDIFKTKVRIKADMCKKVINAPTLQSGSYKLIIDYALAKGLAHEAFGHAIESDSSRGSILFDENGMLKEGMKVASDIVNIIDESIESDNAYQPVSHNGIPRESVYIVRRGILRSGLGDLFSARHTGIEISGAGRQESYSDIPYPRMTNIRIEIHESIPFDKYFDDVTPEDIYDILDKEGVLDDGEPVLYMSGYRGGQVNTKYGNFVFNCSIMYMLEKGKPIQIYKPSIFSGKTLEALKSIKFGIGDVYLDAYGTCGKHGQRVPSSGGSNMFLFIDKSKHIKIGGES